jgi:hypothetical protein
MRGRDRTTFTGRAATLGDVVSTAPPLSTLALSVYGLEIGVESNWAEILDALRLDFGWFVASTRATKKEDVHIFVEQGLPDHARYADAARAFVTPRNVVFQEPERTLVDYFGRVLLVRDNTTGAVEITGDEPSIVHEAAYQFLLSRLGEHFDHMGMPRIHGVGLVGNQGGVVVMLPSGGGKTTLALRALREDSVKLLSDDSPLLDKHGMLHPFPLRIGVNESDAANLPTAAVRRIERMEFHPKLALELEAFADRISKEPAPLRHLVIARRSLGENGRLERLPRRRATGTLFREAVVGVGIYQGMEFVLQHGMRDVVGKAGVARMRAARCARALARANVWLLTLGRDHESNWAALRSLLV